MAEREEKVFATFEKREDILKIQNFLLGRDLLQIEPIPYEEIKEEVMALQKFTELVLYSLDLSIFSLSTCSILVG